MASPALIRKAERNAPSYILTNKNHLRTALRNLAEQPTDPTSPRPLSVDTFIAGLKRKYAGRITGERVIPAREGRYAEFPPELDLRLVTALHKRGIERLYRHQREAWDLVAQGKPTVIVTPTASGKTLCYNLPVLQAALQDQAKSLYLFPTKALSQDQVAEILELNQAGGLGVRAYTFDGDTPGDARKAVRTRDVSPCKRPTRSVNAPMTTKSLHACRGRLSHPD